MIDWSHVNELRADLGDSFGEIVLMFLQEAGEGVARLEDEGQSLRASTEVLAAELHALKGAALNLGLADFAALCAEGETRALAGASSAIDLAAIVACFRASKAALESGLASRAA